VKSILRRAVVFTLGLVSAGCSLHAPYRADASHPIRTITISQNVPIPKKMAFTGLSETLAGAAVVGAVGPAGAGAMTPSHRVGPDFGIADSLRIEFASAIQKSGKFTVKNNGPADAELRLKVEEYGFHSAELFARRVNPTLAVKAQLIRPDGSEAWHFRNIVTHLTSGTPAVFPEKIRENPQVGADALRVAARLCAEKAVETLQK
jgi:hypothetical protein